MADEWNVLPLFDVADVIFGYPFDSMLFHSERVGIPLIRIRDLPAPETCLFTTEAEFPESVRVEPGDLLVGMDAEFRPHRWNGPEALLNQRVCKVVPKSGHGLDREFLRVALRAPLLTIENAKTGTTVIHLNKSDLERVEVPWPRASERRAIAHILGTLDDKIELNRRMNETLEAMARALFKSWFVDFDPVRAKAEGRDPGLPQPLADLFPDSFEDSELGEIPRGWATRELREVLTESNERIGEAEAPEYSSTNAGLQPRSERFKKELSRSSAKNKLIRNGYLVFGLSRRVLNFGLMRDTIGSVSSAYKVFAVDQGMVAPDLLERMMRLQPNYFYNAVSASSREGQSVSAEGLGLLRFAQPVPAVQDAFYRITGPLSSQINALQEQSQSLATLRDTLLPKLISGELRVGDPARLMGREVS